MTLTYSHTPQPEFIRRDPRDLRKKILCAVHSYYDSDRHEYRKAFFVPRGTELPKPPATLESNLPLYAQVPGLIRVS